MAEFCFDRARWQQHVPSIRSHVKSRETCARALHCIRKELPVSVYTLVLIGYDLVFFFFFFLFPLD